MNAPTCTCTFYKQSDTVVQEGTHVHVLYQIHSATCESTCTCIRSIMGTSVYTVHTCTCTCMCICTWNLLHIHWETFVTVVHLFSNQSHWIRKVYSNPMAQTSSSLEQEHERNTNQIGASSTRTTIQYIHQCDIQYRFTMYCTYSG